MYSVLQIRKVLLFILLTFLLCIPLSTVFAQPFTITGRVFRDIGLGNFDGTRNLTDPGVGGVTVTAYSDAGVVATAVSFGTDCRGAGNPIAACAGVNNPPRGSYTLVLPLGGLYRLEFTDPANPNGPMPRGFQPGVFNAAGSETSVQFVNVTADIINQDFALEIVTDYCETNPWLMLPCYASGDPLAVSAPAHPADAATQNVLAAIRYNDNGVNTTAFTVETPADEQTLAVGAQTGTLWGSAYQRESQTLFSAALLKRYSGLGPGGIGQIYSIPFTLAGVAGAPAPFVNIQTDLGINVGQGLVPANGPGFRGLPPRGDVNATDGAAFGLVGKVGLGDIELADDAQSLWFVNLAAADLGTPQVYQMQIDVPPPGTPHAVPVPGDLTAFTIPNPGCVNGVHRPWGLEFYLDRVYVGVVCTAENGGTAADLTGHIYQLDPLGGGAYIANFDLDYPRGFAWSEVGAAVGEWEPWIDVYTDADFNVVINGNGRRAARPQPIISDLEFDVNGTLIIAMMDRAGHQLGLFNNTPDGLFADLSGAVAGDTLRLCFDNGAYALEANTVCPGAAGTAGAGTAQGPGNGEFYFSDILPGVHQETSVGSLTFLVGSGHVVVSMMDPEHTFSGGLSWFNNTTGAESDDITLFRGTSPASNTPGKGNGIGDIELGCPPAPIEIGNYVWVDDDRDGVQDPGEPPIPGVVLELVSPGGVVLATATTDAQGRYLFSSGAGLSNTSYIYNIAGLTFFTTGFQVRVALGQTPLLPYGLTVPANDASLNGVMRDSNAIQVGTNGIITFNTGAAGANNHTYDVGFVRGMSLGNRVWFDTGAVADFDDGQRDAAEVGVAGVTLSLFAANGAGAPVGPVIATDTTDANGFYLFDALLPGNYVVRVDAGNFAAAGPLFGYVTSTPTSGTTNNDVDRDDNGLNDPGYLANGIFSALVTLALDTEPVNEGTELSGNTLQDGPNSRGLSNPTDNNSNLTVDFGFWPPIVTPTPSPSPTLGTPGTPGTPGPGAGTPGLVLTPTASGSGVTILKTANRVFARPGQDVTWTITVQNNTTSTIDNIVVTDTMPSGLTIGSQQVTQGTITLSGMTYNWVIGTLQPGESATLIISTMIDPSISIPFRIINEAEVIVSQDINPQPAISSAQVVSISSLPETGEIPWWAETGRVLLMLLSVAAVSVFVIGMGLRLKKL